MQPTMMPPGTDPTAVMGRRVASFLVDWILIIAVGAGIFFATVEFVEYQEDEAPRHIRIACNFDDFETRGSTGNHICLDLGDRIWYAEGSDAGTAQLVSWAYTIGVFFVMQGLTGKTPGKIVAGVRTVRADGQPPGILKAFLRHLLWVVDLFPYCLPGLTGYLVANSSKQHRRVGDMVAGTYVVAKEYAGQPVAPVAAPQAGWGTPGVPAPGMPVSAPPPMTVGGPPPTSAPAAAPAPGAAADPTQPQWDAARNAYIAWDAKEQVWKQFDDAAQEWRPIG
jgi:uncharacterized RDD family membrane protein YckC